MSWTRTCQECGHRQSDTPARFSKDGELTIAYRNRKCKRCKSEALDFGTEPSDEEPRLPKEDTQDR